MKITLDKVTKTGNGDITAHLKMENGDSLDLFLDSETNVEAQILDGLLLYKKSITRTEVTLPSKLAGRVFDLALL